MPVTFTCLTIAGLGLTGVPLFAGFISKWQLAQAAISSIPSMGSYGWLPVVGVAILLISALLTSIYMLSITVRAFAHPLPASAAGGEAAKTCEAGTTCEAGWKILVPLCIFAVLVLVFGVYPQPLIRLVTAIAQGTF